MSQRTLIYGFGNPGRSDDGLGPALVRELAQRGLRREVAVESGYQLAIEDSALVAEQDIVIFADADRACRGPFELRRITPRRETSFTTHSVTPAVLLGLAHEHFECRTLGFEFGIRGYEFDEFGEALSPQARRNLLAAVNYLDRVLRDGSLASEAVSADPER